MLAMCMKRPMGSSPRVWGAPQQKHHCLKVFRLIPTCVGSTSPGRGVRIPCAAHPHVCGEHQDVVAGAHSRRGSSPRVWGARYGLRPFRGHCRLIPTCVGSTSLILRRLPPRSAHPHVCGEHDDDIMWNLHNFGSSPRVWGAPSRITPPHSTARLIPTCVGSTPRYPAPARSHSAHPHVCGEHLAVWAIHSRASGSSPRVWGARPVGVPFPGFCRLIPTCVGSTPSPSGLILVVSAHPHVCGEHYLPGHVNIYEVGSSPRVWGARRSLSRKLI